MPTLYPERQSARRRKRGEGRRKEGVRERTKEERGGADGSVVTYFCSDRKMTQFFAVFVSLSPKIKLTQ